MRKRITKSVCNKNPNSSVYSGAKRLSRGGTCHAREGAWRAQPQTILLIEGRFTLDAPCDAHACNQGADAAPTDSCRGKAVVNFKWDVHSIYWSAPGCSTH